MDKEYDFPEIEYRVRRRGYVDHIRRKGEVLKKNLCKAKRWVVERTASWHNRFRKLLARFEKKEENYQALVEFANCLNTNSIKSNSPVSSHDFGSTSFGITNARLLQN